MEIIRELCSFEGRLAGTDAERRAANRLAERLRELGRRAEVEPTYVHPQSALVYAAHCLLGFAGSLVAVAVPALGFGLVLLAATSMYLDLNAPLLPPAPPLLPPRLAERRLAGTRARRTGPADHQRPLRRRPHRRRLRAGTRARRFARLASASALPARPVPDPLLVAGGAAPAARRRGWPASTPSSSRCSSSSPPWSSSSRSSPSSRSSSRDVVPGANDNASGVADRDLARRRARRASRPQNLDVWVVLDRRRGVPAWRACARSCARTASDSSRRAPS